MIHILITLLFSFLLENIAYADLRDYAFAGQYDKLLQAMENPEFFHSSSKFYLEDIKKSIKTNSIYDVEVIGQTQGTYTVRALIHENEHFFFRYLSVSKLNFATTVIKDLALLDVGFEATVSLKDRLLVLESKEFDVKLVYPIGVGALDEGYRKNPNGEIRSLTPDWEGASLERKWLEMNRKYPKHFKGRPFIRATTPKKDYSSIGFHILQTKALDRSYQSRGCVRMREGDLYELAAIVKYGKLTSIPLNITYKTLEETHPIDRSNDYYYRPRNFGTRNNPLFKKDEYGLLITERVKKPVPLDKLPQ